MSYERNQIIALIYRIFQAEDYRYVDMMPSYDKIVKNY